MKIRKAGVDASPAEAKACRMEHTVSDESFGKLREQEQRDKDLTDSCDSAL